MLKCRYITPTCADGSVPTIVAVYNQLATSNMVDVAHFPKAGVFEIHKIKSKPKMMFKHTRTHIVNAVSSVNGKSVSRCIKAQYWKNSLANYIHQDGLGATAILEIWRETKT